jgi:hypothetical protein
MARARSVIVVRGFSVVPIRVWVCPDQFRTQDGDAIFSEVIRTFPTFCIEANACGDVACFKGKVLDVFEDRVDTR